MGYPIIVTGAGASYDLYPMGETPAGDRHQLLLWQPPLTKDLFDGTRFQSLIDQYPEMTSTVSYIRSKLRSQGTSFELEKSFVALLFYLSDLLGNVTRGYFRLNNNYSTLHHWIKQTGNKAIFVNFNYDLLLEKTLGKSNATNVDEYIEGTLPIIKIHGACNWYYKRKMALFDEKPSYDVYVNAPDPIFRPEDFSSSQLIILNDRNPKNILSTMYGHRQGYGFHPALALPIVEKANFVCPDGHVDLLKAELNKIDRILIVGWRATDNFLKELLLSELKKRKIKIAYIGSTDLDKTLESLPEEFQENIVIASAKGFTDFMSSDEGENFLG
jgi:hypothetical protein